MRLLVYLVLFSVSHGMLAAQPPFFYKKKGVQVIEEAFELSAGDRYQLGGMIDSMPLLEKRNRPYKTSTFDFQGRLVSETAYLSTFSYAYVDSLVFVKQETPYDTAFFEYISYEVEDTTFVFQRSLDNGASEAGMNWDHLRQPDTSYFPELPKYEPAKFDAFFLWKMFKDSSKNQYIAKYFKHVGCGGLCLQSVIERKPVNERLFKITQYYCTQIPERYIYKEFSWYQDVFGKTYLENSKEFNIPFQKNNAHSFQIFDTKYTLDTNDNWIKMEDLSLCPSVRLRSITYNK